MSDLVLDSGKSRVRIHTFAEGLLARLAHDLELSCRTLTGKATREAATGRAEILAKLQDLEVAGVLTGNRVDERALSPSDRRDILEKMKREVFHAGDAATLRVEATLANGSARIELVPPNGRAVAITARAELRDEDGAVRVDGSFDVSLSSIGSDAVKGPMGAFRVKDKVTVLFDLVFQPA